MRKLCVSFIGLFFVFMFLLTGFAKAGFDNKNKRECPILIEMGEWQYYEKGNDWERNQSWYLGDGWVSERLSGLYIDQKHKSYTIQNDQSNSAVLVYIGPWQKVTLTKGFLWNKEETEVEIRMIASQKGKYLENHYETKDEINAKIPEQKFVLLEEPDDLIVKCDILRAQKFGYNAVLDGHINVFRAYIGKSILSTSGKIIDSETGEVIADENGNLIKTKE